MPKRCKNATNDSFSVFHRLSWGDVHGRPHRAILLFAGIHGHELSGSQWLADHIRQTGSYTKWDARDVLKALDGQEPHIAKLHLAALHPDKASHTDDVFIVPSFNREGICRHRRTDRTGRDLNRQFVPDTQSVAVQMLMCFVQYLKGIYGRNLLVVDFHNCDVYGGDGGMGHNLYATPHPLSIGLLGRIISEMQDWQGALTRPEDVLGLDRQPTMTNCKKTRSRSMRTVGAPLAGSGLSGPPGSFRAFCGTHNVPYILVEVYSNLTYDAQQQYVDRIVSTVFGLWLHSSPPTVDRSVVR